ncbi:hypothetical protein GCM10007359_17360 [Rothia aerolata]|uniref:Uncharacterized protein n=1 Tax=Rothia aerolata TaxID=1812262 RepID=A0A917IW09_9MICC|nr:hypothetical protein GCM10007359_17360 [Rothia aerolata]
MQREGLPRFMFQKLATSLEDAGSPVYQQILGYIPLQLTLSPHASPSQEAGICLVCENSIALMIATVPVPTSAPAAVSVNQ